ncbi:hypothetical protein BH23ACT10_BH23ACT10_09520 [soil metagenome]
MDAALRELLTDLLPSSGTVLVPDGTGPTLPIDPARVRTADVADLPAGEYAAAVLIDDELSRAGDHTEGLIDALGTALESGGLLIATMRNRVHARATGDPLAGMRGFSAAEAESLVNQRGFAVQLLCAPGAAARLAGNDAFDPQADREPGLLDAAPTVLLAARAPRSAKERSQMFHDSRPRKIAAAAALCRDADGRLLVVYDRFKRSWTIPGGVVDADEDPAAAAQREAWEESGIKVTTGPLLGVFGARWPDRLVFVFEATPVEMIERPTPLHPHEISDVAWLPLDEALTRLAPHMAFKVRTCLATPGLTWMQ